MDRDERGGHSKRWKDIENLAYAGCGPRQLFIHRHDDGKPSTGTLPYVMSIATRSHSPAFACRWILPFYPTFTCIPGSCKERPKLAQDLERGTPGGGGRGEG